MILETIKKNKNILFVFLLFTIILVVNLLFTRRETKTEKYKNSNEVVPSNLEQGYNLDSQFPHAVYEGFTSFEKAIVNFSSPEIGTGLVQAEFSYSNVLNPKTNKQVKEEMLIGVSKNDDIMVYDKKNNKWNKIRGHLSNICARNRDLIVGVSRNGDIFYTQNGLTENIHWEKLPYIKRGKTISASVGFDGTLVALNVLTPNLDSLLISELYKYNPPKENATDQNGDKLGFNEGTWEKVGQNLRNVDVRNEEEMWGTTYDNLILKYQKEGNKWLNVPGSLSKVSVGEDGAAWGIDEENYLYMLTKKNNWDLMDKKRQFIDVDVRDKSLIVCVGIDNKVLFGEVSGFPSIPEPVETPFQTLGYSCAHNGFLSESQNTKTPKAYLEVNYKTLFDSTFDSSKSRDENFADGYVLVAVDEYGNEILNKQYRMNDFASGNASRDPLAIKNPDLNKANVNNSSILLRDFDSLKIDKLNIISPNIVKQFSPDYSQLPKNLNKNELRGYYRVLNRFKNHVAFYQTRQVGFYSSEVEENKTYKISFKYKLIGGGNEGKFNVFSKGAGGNFMDEAISVSSSVGDNYLEYTKEYKFESGGDFNLYFALAKGGQILEIKEVSVTKKEDIKREAVMIFLFTEGVPSVSSENYVPKDYINFNNEMQKRGFARIPDIRATSSYFAAFNVPRNRVLFEELNDNSEVSFVSEGKTPVIDSAFTKGNMLKDTPDAYDKFLTHLKESVLWSMANHSILQKSTDDNEVIPQISNLPNPFNQRIDSAINLMDTANADSRNVLLTRGSLFVNYDIKAKRIQSGPNKIGTEQLKLQDRTTGKVAEVFKKGIDAGCGLDTGKYLIFRGKYYAIADESLSNLDVIGTRDGDSSPFKDLPESFKNKIDAAVNAGGVHKNKIFLFSGDGWVRMLRNADNTFTIDLGPDSLVTHPNFNRLPLSYRLGLNKLSPEPFLNHSKFARNALKNYDITVRDGGLRGLSGWDKRNFVSIQNPVSKKMFPSYNRNVVYNYEKPPVIVSRYKKLYPGKFDEKSTNEVLKHYEQFGKVRKDMVNRYGGNTVSFSLYEDPATKIRKGKWASSGKRAELFPGNFYKFSIWVKTSNVAGFKIQPVLGNIFALDKASQKAAGNIDKNFEAKEIIKSDGWQLLEWNKQLKATELYTDLSFIYEQKDADNSIHSLYGPIAKPLIRYPDTLYINDLIGNTVVGQSNVYNIISLIKSTAYSSVFLQGKNDKTMSACKEEKCSQANGLFMPHERFIFYKREKDLNDNMPDRYIISSAYLTTTQNKGSDFGGSLNITINKDTKKVELTENTDSGIDFYLLINDNNNLMFLHINTNTFLSYDGNNLVGKEPLEDPNKMIYSTFNVVKLNKYLLEKKMAEGFTNYEGFATEGAQSEKEPDHIAYIQAICPFNYSNKNSDRFIYLFRNHQFCIFDLETNGYVLSTNSRKKHSTFSKLPRLWNENMNVVEGQQVPIFPGFDKNIDAAFSIHPKSDIVYLFNNSFFIIWDLSEGTYADPNMLVEKYGYPEDLGNNKPYIMGPGSAHPWFSRLPAPFNKKIDAAFNADGGDKVILMSSGFWCLWDLSTHEISDLNKDKIKSTDINSAESDIRPLTGLKAGWARGLPKRIANNIDSAIALPNELVGKAGYEKGSFYLFSGKQFKICRMGTDQNGNIDYLSDCSVEPSGGSSGYFLGSNKIFKNLPKEFKPNKAELCKSYLNVTEMNSNIPKELCKPDPNAEYKWIDHCPYLKDNEKYCEKAGGQYNDDKQMCASPNDRSDKYKKTDASLKDKFQLLYEKECRTISKFDKLDMNDKETVRNKGKSDEIQAELELIKKRNNEKSQYNTDLGRLQVKYDYMPGEKDGAEPIKRDEMYPNFFGSNRQENITNINNVRKLFTDKKVGYKQMEKYWTGRACEPVRTCEQRPSTDEFRIPDSCKTPEIKLLLKRLKNGEPLLEGDINILTNIIQKNVVIDDYPIQKHPDYKKFISAKFVKKCPNIKMKDVNSFGINEFEDRYKYIEKSKLKPVPPVKVVNQPYRARRAVDMSSSDTRGSSIGENTQKSQESEIEKKYGYILRRIENGTLLLEDITKVLRNEKEVRDLMNYFKSKEGATEGFQNQERSADFYMRSSSKASAEPNKPRGIVRLLDLLVKKNIYGRDAKMFMGWLNSTTNYKSIPVKNLLSIKDFKTFNDTLEQAVKEYNNQNPNNQINQGAQAGKDANGCDVKTQKYCASFNSCVSLSDLGSCPSEYDKNSSTQSSVNDLKKASTEGKTEVELKNTIVRLQEQMKNVLSELNKCQSGAKIIELKAKMDQLNNYTNELKEKLKTIRNENTNKNSKCKELKDFRIQNHPDFVRNNHNVSCWGCSDK